MARHAPAARTSPEPEADTLKDEHGRPRGSASHDSLRSVLPIGAQPDTADACALLSRAGADAGPCRPRAPASHRCAARRTWKHRDAVHHPVRLDDPDARRRRRHPRRSNGLRDQAPLGPAPHARHRAGARRRRGLSLPGVPVRHRRQEGTERRRDVHAGGQTGCARELGQAGDWRAGRPRRDARRCAGHQRYAGGNDEPGRVPRRSQPTG